MHVSEDNDRFIKNDGAKRAFRDSLRGTTVNGLGRFGPISA